MSAIMDKNEAAKLWDAIIAGNLPAPPQAPKPAQEPDHWHQPPRDPAHYYRPGEWEKVETQLVVSRTKCKCGCIFEAPNRLMNLWTRERTTERKWVALKPEEGLGSTPRVVRYVDHQVDFCQHCFTTAPTIGTAPTKGENNDDNV